MPSRIPALRLNHRALPNPKTPPKAWLRAVRRSQSLRVPTGMCFDHQVLGALSYSSMICGGDDSLVYSIDTWQSQCRLDFVRFFRRHCATRAAAGHLLTTAGRANLLICEATKVSVSMALENNKNVLMVHHCSRTKHASVASIPCFYL